jgi:hypothetical protein
MTFAGRGRFGGSMRIRKTVLAGCSVAVAAFGSVLVSAPAAHADVIGCSPGYACIVNPSPQPIGTVEAHYYYYGVYNLSGQYGSKQVCNQQTGWAVVRLYSGYSASGSVLKTIRAADSGGHAASCPTVNMTPVNSIRLSSS